MAEVKIEGITKKYGKKKILDNYSLHINDGECFSILGPSPCGKTTVLRSICGFEKLDKGEIRIGEKIVVNKEKNIFVPPEIRNIGVVFQDYAVWPHMTAYENVYYPLKKKWKYNKQENNIDKKDYKKDADKKAINALNQVKLGDYIKRLPHQLSGGQQQRVALARALVSSSKLIILDEPLCNLDANLREEMRFEIKELQRKINITVILVTHDQADALAVSDRVAVMDKTGKIRQIGIPEELYKKPVDSFVFKFLGLSNFIPLKFDKNKVRIKDYAPNIIFPYSIPSNIRSEEFYAAFRPDDIKLIKNGELKAEIKRVIFLGNIYEYRINLGNIEIRVQQDSFEAVKNGLFKKGDICGIELKNIRYYETIEEVD